MIKAEWTNADALNLQPTCNQLATDCISRQAAIDALKAHEDYKGYLHGDFEEILEALPSAQPERKTGRWITKSTNGEWFDCCSECGYVEWNEPKNYCPNCGAKMEVEHEQT